MSLQVEYVPIGDILPYENNAKIHTDDQIEEIANSIEEFGMIDPIGVWKNNEIIEGHGRLMACQKLGIKTVPIIRLDELTNEQRKAYALVHNKLTMNTDFDFSLLDEELASLSNIDMSLYGFEEIESKASDWFQERKRYDNEGIDEESEEYQEFVEKFEQKRTTDDCYTPDAVYEAVVNWVIDEYGVSRENMVRPFYPGGDYQKERYKPTDVVVDNPPFSILSEILNFYNDHGVKFFLFAPGLTLFSSSSTTATALCCGVSVTYENGANVGTSFLTNLDDPEIRLRTAPTLYRAVKEANDEVLKQMRKELPKYSYPDNVVTAAMVSRWSKYGIDFKLTRAESEKVSMLDEQKASGKEIFGGGYLISDKAAAERAAAERAAAERALAEHWTLSERERKIVEKLNDGSDFS